MGKTIYDQSGRFAIYNRSNHKKPFLLHDSQTGENQSFATQALALAEAEKWKQKTPTTPKGSQKKSSRWLPKSLRK